MADYLPLDISAHCNRGVDLCGVKRRPAIGEQQFRGLPFRIGGALEAPCFIAFADEAMETVSIPVGQTATYVIFAHALQRSQLLEGDIVGETVADYIFHYVDGVSASVPIRDRYEIAVVPLDLAWFPFLALPDQKNERKPRWEGNWRDAGLRPAEVTQAIPQDYYLWEWRNPRPECEIESIEIRPAGYLTFFIAGITLSQVNEAPFSTTAAVPVVLTLKNEQDTAGPFELDVMVDRGEATYPYTLPPESVKEFLNSPRPGWGEPLNETNNPVHLKVTAIPSAMLKVTRGEEEIARTNWGELERNGQAETERAHFEVVNSGINWVHTTVVDDTTGQPIPCRVHFRSARGIPYQPAGHPQHVNSNIPGLHNDVGGDVRLGHVSYAYIDGHCQGWLPRGEVLVDVARGFEYQPLRARLHIEPGQRELTLRLQRRYNLQGDRYFSGDPHVHFMSSQGALTEAAGEDLNVVSLLLTQVGHMFMNTEEFTGQPQVSHDGSTIVFAAQENRQHMLGHITLLGQRSLIAPWCSDGPGEAELGGNLETTLSYWADECHAQGGTVILPHLPNPNGETAALIATGRGDAVEMLVHNNFFHIEYYRYLNGGYRLPLVGGTDKMDGGVPVGLCRTYAYIPLEDEFTYYNWLNALRGGNTFLSSGPLLRFTVNGQPIGSTLQLSRNGGTVEIEAAADSTLPIHSLQIVRGGRVVAETAEKEGAHSLKLRTTLKIESSDWLCARCAGPDYTSIKHHDSWKRGIMAHTSPIYLACGEYDVFHSETARYMLRLLDGSLQHINQRALHWKKGMVTHHHHEVDHLEFLERPFREAIEAVHRKCHQHGIPHPHIMEQWRQ